MNLLAVVVAALAFAQMPAYAGSASPATQRQIRTGAKISHAESDRLTCAVARMYHLDPSLLSAITRVESGGNPHAVSAKGAEGIMQLMPATAIRFGVIDPFDPVSNMLGAARFLAYLRGYHLPTDGGAGAMSLPELLAAYNAGEGAVDKFGGIPPYPETRDYVRRVLIAYLLGDDQGPLAKRLRAASASAQAQSAGDGSSARIRTATSHRRAEARSSADLLAELGAIRTERARGLDRERMQGLAGPASAPNADMQGAR